jgi:hypothetical protein
MLLTEHHSKKIGEQKFDTRKQGVHRCLHLRLFQSLCLSSHLCLLSHPSCSVGCHVFRLRLDLSLHCWFSLCLASCPCCLIANLPGATSGCTPYVWLVCSIARPLGLSCRWLSCCLSSRHCLLCVYASHL